MKREITIEYYVRQEKLGDSKFSIPDIKLSEEKLFHLMSKMHEYSVSYCTGKVKPNDFITLASSPDDLIALYAIQKIMKCLDRYCLSLSAFAGDPNLVPMLGYVLGQGSIDGLTQALVERKSKVIWKGH